VIAGLSDRFGIALEQYVTMTTPQLITLEPVVLTNNRISLNLVTKFPPQSNVALLNFEFDDTPPQQKSTPAPLDLDEAIRTSPYPNVELRILDEEHHEVASLFIVEHRDPNLSLMLHLRQPQPGKQYLAQADLIYQQKLLQTLTVPFGLPAGAVNEES
jgi:hypothetical protein